MTLIWDPWNPESNYGQGVRLLAIGLSHKAKNVIEQKSIENDRNFTKDVVQGHIEGRHTHRFFVKLGMALKNDGEDCREVFRRVAFYNMIQKCLLDGEKTQFSDYDDHRDSEAFKQVIGLTKPTHILLSGVNFWNNYHFPLRYRTRISMTGDERIKTHSAPRRGYDLGWFEVEGHKSIMMPIVHPSYWGKQAKQLAWRNSIQKFLLKTFA